MKAFFRSRKGIALLATTAVAVIAAVIAYAYFTSSGSGTGTVTVGTAADVQLSSDPAVNVVPGQSVPVTVHIHNPSPSSLFVAGITGSVETTGDCLGSWFVVSPVDFSHTIAAGSTSDVSTSLAMTETNTNQDACQGKTLTIDWTTGSGGSTTTTTGGGGGGNPTNTVLGDCKFDDGSSDDADFPASGPHSESLCVNGVAEVQCEVGWDNVDGDWTNGCEVNFMTDVHNCGTIGNDVSQLPNAIGACTGGVGVIVACNTGFADADLIVADGCEINLMTDVQHCGSLGNDVSALPHVAVAACTAGVGQIIACQTGWANSDNNPSNGCETSLASFSGVRTSEGRWT